MMERLHVFVDEFGDPHLDVRKDGVSSTYIVAAVCVRAGALPRVVGDAEKVRAKYFQTGEMKSSSVGAKEGRRLHIVRALLGLDVFVIAFCARKRSLDPNSGLAFKKSFIKYFARTLCDRVTRCGDDVEFVLDEHGGEQFQNELKTYLESRFRNDLFSSRRFEFKDSKTSVLLQAADFFAGSLARVYDEQKLSGRSEELRDALLARSSVTLWPVGRDEGGVPISSHRNEDDEIIRRYCLQRAKAYLANLSHTPGDIDEKAQAVFLDALIAHHSLGEPGSFLATSVLKREISSQTGQQISDHRFRSAVVAKLRDADVIISSCSKGYRIPSSLGDILEYTSFSNSIIPPMVSRLERARKGIREATLGRIDILSGDELVSLRSIAESLQKQSAVE